MGTRSRRILLPALLPLACLLLAPGSASAFQMRVGYYAGKLGAAPSPYRNSPEVQMILRRDGLYMLGLWPTLHCPGGRRVRVELRLNRLCRLGTHCGRQAIGFSFNLHFTNNRTFVGTWMLDRRRYPGCSVPSAERRVTGHWRANPHISISPSRAPRGSVVTVTGTGFLPREPIYVIGNSPIFQIGAPFLPNRNGYFRRRVVIHPNQAPGFYPDVYLFQRSCLTVCWVKGSTSLRVL